MTFFYVIPHGKNIYTGVTQKCEYCEGNIFVKCSYLCQGYIEI